VPIRDFRLNLESGSDGILTPVRRSLCARKHRATLAMRGHNGKGQEHDDRAQDAVWQRQP
jgi:hypothetical protein